MLFSCQRVAELSFFNVEKIKVLLVGPPLLIQYVHTRGRPSKTPTDSYGSSIKGNACTQGCLDKDERFSSQNHAGTFYFCWVYRFHLCYYSKNGAVLLYTPEPPACWHSHNYWNSSVFGCLQSDIWKGLPVSWEDMWVGLDSVAKHFK